MSGDEIEAGQVPIPAANLDPNSDTYNYSGPSPAGGNSRIENSPGGTYATTYDTGDNTPGEGIDMDEYFKKHFSNAFSNAYG